MIETARFDREDPYQHRFTRQEVLVRGPQGARAIEWAGSMPGGQIASIQVEKAPGGHALLALEYHACAGGDSLELFVHRGGELVSVGRFDPPVTEEIDPPFSIALQRGADGAVQAVEVTDDRKITRHAWKDGHYAP